MLTKAERSTTTIPSEALIPEARERQRRRYLRSGLLAAVGALVIATLIAAGVSLFSGPSTNGGLSVGPSVGVTATSSGTVYFRPVRCVAPPYRATTTASAAAPTCSAASQLTQQNLGIASSARGFRTGSVPADASLANVPSTTLQQDKPTSTVLLPGLATKGNTSGPPRYILGPAEMSTRSIASAVAQRGPDGQWVVHFSTTTAGAALWDKLAHENFHQLIAIDFNGVVYSAPLMQPAQAHFSSFDGQGDVSGNLTGAEASHLAAAMKGHR
jgi:hypothetical protein